jgi:hypothetical protein
MEERCESCRKVLGRGWKYDSAGEAKLCPRCYAALRQEPADSCPHHGDPETCRRKEDEKWCNPNH